MTKRTVKHKVVMAIDPGIPGAMAFVDYKNGTLLQVFNNSIYKVSGKNHLDLPIYLEEIEFYKVVGCIIEKVTAGGPIGKTAAFSFGGSFMVPQAFCTALRIPYELVLPTVWKKAYGLHKADKDASRNMAKRIYPEQAFVFKLKSDHNKADAVLMARYYWSKLTGADIEPIIKKGQRITLEK